MTGGAREARVRVPGSTSNLGAGFDVVGLALNRWLEVSFTPGGDRLAVTWEEGPPAPPRGDLLARAFREGLAARGLPAHGTLTARSSIPVSRGLGSSAASVVAGAALAARVAGDAVDPDAAFAAGLDAEGHGDNAAPSAFGGLCAVVGGGARVLRLELAEGLGFAFAAPPTRVATRVARAALPERVPHAVAVEGLGRLAALLRGLATGDPELLALGFDDALHVPYRLPLVDGGAETLAAARDAGAWAATVSGSGSGLIAVTPPARAAEVAAAMGETLARRHPPEGVEAFEVRPVSHGVVDAEGPGIASSPHARRPRRGAAADSPDPDGPSSSRP